jgi:hypothetical protein
VSEFEYISVFVSIIFGISVTHIMAGVMRSFYRGERDETILVLTAFLFLVLILNWWVSYTWRDEIIWSFERFLIIIVWAVSHYVAAITLYPPLASGAEQPFARRRHWFLWAFFGIAITDLGQAWAKGELLDPWYYLPFVVHYAVLALVGIALRKPAFYRWMAWYFLTSMALWSFIVRRFLE